MIKSYKKISKLNNSIQGAITCNNLTINNNLISNQVAYNLGLTGVTGSTGPAGPIKYGTLTGPTGANITGPTGKKGNSNITNGNKGPTGPTGPTGISLVGYDGPKGETGYSYQGPTGHIGKTATGYTGPTGPTLTYTSISGSYDGVSSSDNQLITALSLDGNSYLVQWYVNLTSQISSDVIDIYFGFNEDVQMIKMIGNTLSGYGIYDSSNIIFQCYYYDGSNTFSIEYNIVYLNLFN